LTARNHLSRLRLEALEGRAVPASLATPNLLAADVADQSALTRRFLLAPSPTPPDGLAVITLAELAAVSAPLPQSAQVLSAPGLLSSGSGAQAQPGASAADQAVLDFAGRLAFPGTGLEVRVANGNGPLTQPPGLYLVGGGSQPDDQGAAAAQGGGSSGDQGDAPDDLGPDVVWAGLDWLALALG
jgi:hypothetical protein